MNWIDKCTSKYVKTDAHCIRMKLKDYWGRIENGITKKNMFVAVNITLTLRPVKSSITLLMIV